jgi:dipeptide transport system permease protein
MFKWLLQKLASLIPTLIGVSIVSFGLIRLVPGDPAMLLLGERGADPSVYASMRANMGLDLPIWKQYFLFISSAVSGDLGTSVVSRLPVAQEFWDRFPATLELGLLGLTFAIILGIPLGILAALKRKSFLDYSVMGFSLTGYSMPIFWWGLVLILIFSVQLGITPVSGRIGVEFDIPRVTGFFLLDAWFSEGGGKEAFVSAFRHLILPSIVLGTIPLAVIARMTRSSLLEVLGEDYIRTARAKGLGGTRVITVHALRNALIPIVTVIGLMFGTLLTGAILTETIFSWPGIGKWLVKSVTSRDYPVIQSGILLIAIMVMMVNLLVDFLYALINPRIHDPRK